MGNNVLGLLFSDIAAAIRAQNGESGTMKPADFPEKILALNAGGVSSEPLSFATGEFEVTSTGAIMITHNLGVTPDIVLYFLCKATTGTILTDSSSFYSGEIAYSAEAMADGANRMIYLINGASLQPTLGIFETDDALNELGCVHSANPESFVVGSTVQNWHCPTGKYRWVAIGNLYEHDEWLTARFYDGEELLKTEMVRFGTVVTPPDLTKGGYRLSWNPSDMTVKADTDFMAVWELIQVWATTSLADYLTDTDTYTVPSSHYAKPNIQFISGATWASGGAVSQLDETHSVFNIRDVVDGKTSATFTAKATWTYVSYSGAATDGLNMYINWFDENGEFLDYTFAYTSGKFASSGSRTVTKTVTIPDGACFMGVNLSFAGYARSASFSGVSATLKMVVS